MKHLCLAFASSTIALSLGSGFAQQTPSPAPAAVLPASAAAPEAAASGAISPVPSQSKPRVYLQASSKGNQWAAHRDQAMEMSKDFEKNCPDVRITLNQPNADYTIMLNHIEVGWNRDNQFQIANKDGDLITHTKEGGSINKGVKNACSVILADWANNKK